MANLEFRTPMAKTSTTCQYLDSQGIAWLATKVASNVTTWRSLKKQISGHLNSMIWQYDIPFLESTLIYHLNFMCWVLWFQFICTITIPRQPVNNQNLLSITSSLLGSPSPGSLFFVQLRSPILPRANLLKSQSIWTVWSSPLFVTAPWRVCFENHISSIFFRDCQIARIRPSWGVACVCSFQLQPFKHHHFQLQSTLRISWDPLNGRVNEPVWRRGVPQNDASDEKGFSDTLGNLTSSNWQCHL